jgi:exopolyphosphatase/guanosine-5'-triphosphate,3'-diphosphate pyrophosphatase
MKIAAIDIGTNSVHMIVVKVRPDLSFEVIDREKEMVRLGAGGLDGRALTESAMAAGLQALAKFRRLADSYGVDDIVASATSATREAENGGDFLDAIAEQTGIRVRVISGSEEARLIHRAAGYGIDLGGRQGVVIDVGGGSVEITYGPATEAKLARSFKLGVIRLAERFVTTDPISASDERRLVRHITREVADHVGRINRKAVARVIGTSGTILSLGALAAAEEAGAVPDDLRNLRVSAKAVHRVRKRLTGMTQQERLDVAGLDPRRADLAVGGAILLDTLLDLLGATDLTLCDMALREGLVLDYVQRNRAHIVQVDHYPDIRRRSVLELAERCNYWPEHAAQVTRLALSLFDATRRLHGLGDTEREWLEYAGLLHDIGMHISYEGHHKHAQYLIQHGGLRGFEPQEVDVIGLVAKYHRRGLPKKSDEGFAALPKAQRTVVRTLAAVTALAESLDRSHAQVIRQVVPRQDAEGLTLTLKTAGDAELEVWAASRHLDPLATALGVPVRLAVSPPTTRPGAAPRARRHPGGRQPARRARRARPVGPR